MTGEGSDNVGQERDNLQQLRGIGKALAQRLCAAGLDTFAKVAAAGEDGLKKIPGISPRALPHIVEQARQLAGHEAAGPEERGESLKSQAALLREKVQAVAQAARERYQPQLTGKRGRKLSRYIVEIDDALASIGNGGGAKRHKRLLKALGKVEKRVSGLEEASLKRMMKHVKRARKVVAKAL
jgi:ribosomal protein S13